MKRILACTDLSNGARRALDRAVSLAMQTGARLDVIHAAPDDSEDGATLRSRLLQETQLAAARLGAGGIEIRTVMSVFGPEKAILHRAERTGPDLIVLGGHGKPRLRDAIFGTTATHIVRHSPVPVLIVQTDPALPYLKLMVAAAQPRTAERLVENALSIAPAAEVFTVHAFQASFMDLVGSEEMFDQLAVGELQRMETALARVAAAHPEALVDAKRHIIADPGDAATVLMDEAVNLTPDLVIMGASHRSTFIGSHAVDACFWCPADLLIVPEPVPADA